jgi:hypothetical protein
MILSLFIYIEFCISLVYLYISIVIITRKTRRSLAAPSFEFTSLALFYNYCKRFSSGATILELWWLWSWTKLSLAENNTIASWTLLRPWSHHSNLVLSLLMRPDHHISDGLMVSVMTFNLDFLVWIHTHCSH